MACSPSRLHYSLEQKFSLTFRHMPFSEDGIVKYLAVHDLISADLLFSTMFKASFCMIITAGLLSGVRPSYTHLAAGVPGEI